MTRIVIQESIDTPPIPAEVWSHDNPELAAQTYRFLNQFTVGELVIGDWPVPEVEPATPKPMGEDDLQLLKDAGHAGLASALAAAGKVTDCSGINVPYLIEHLEQIEARQAADKVIAQRRGSWISRLFRP